MNGANFGFDTVFDAFGELRKTGRFNESIWRQLHCRCCRDIWEFVDDPRSQQAVEVAEAFLEGAATQSDLRDAYTLAKRAEDERWDHVRALREEAGDDWIWPLDAETDLAWVRYCAAGAAAQCASDPAVDDMLVATPDFSASVRPWCNSRTDVLSTEHQLYGSDLRKAIECRWQELYSREENMHVGMLCELLEK